MTTSTTAPDTVVLVHGLWMTPRCWERWIEHYEARGLRVIAPAYPGFEVEVEALRADPSPIARLTIEETVAHLESSIRKLDKPPIIMGHSFGGALTQLLLNRGLGAAGVAINSVFTKGVFLLPWTLLRSTFPVLGNPLNRTRAVGSPMTVDYHKPDRAPLLFITGGKDHIMPASLNRSNASKYGSGIVAVKEYADRDHYTCGAPGWEKVADDALTWALAPKPAVVSEADPGAVAQTA